METRLDTAADPAPAAPPRPPARRPSYPLWLLAAFAVYWAVLAVRPWDRKNWVLEHVLTVAFVAALVWSRKRFPLSNLSYTLVFVYLCLHTLGAHTSYSRVPYDAWSRALFGTSISDAFGWRRNHFDRLVHFCFGLLLAYPIRELFLRVAGVRGFWGYYLPLDVTMSFSMLYELIEWGAAMVLGSELGQAYLGTQGDVWDAHKDMALASLGALVSMVVVALINWKFDKNFGAELRDSFSVKGAALGETRLRELMKR